MLNIRVARIKDLSIIHALIQSATHRGKILKRSRPDLRKAIRHFWVVEEEGRVIACCALEIYNRKLAEIRSLAVEPGREKKGIATHLIEHCLRQAKRKKIYEVLAITDRENLFRRQGFSEQLHGQKALFLRP
jgi:amino-acid N-acetyltransferase